MEIKVKVWIEDENKNLIFGSGKTEILRQIEETGSISEAAKKVGMNYKKAWSHIKILEEYKDIDDLPVQLRATYNLLLIEARDKNYVVHTSDSLINTVVNYFEHSDDPVKINNAVSNLRRICHCSGSACNRCRR